MSDVSAETPQPWVKLLIVLLGIALWLSFRNGPPVPDAAWLMEGARRWLGGQELFVDVRELNPPLIFYEMVALSGGTLMNSAFVAGVAIATVVSSLWVARHHGDWLGFGTFISITAAGAIEFGQREHLLLVFVVPYLLGGGARRERTLMGLWAFFGVALKPYFLPIVVLPALIEAWRDRSSLFAAEKLALSSACIAYVIGIYLFYPAYFRDMVPLGQQVYTYGGEPLRTQMVQSAIVGLAILLADAKRRPLAAAAAGALASYYLQGRFWPYHFIAAAGLGMLLCFWQRRPVLLTILLATQILRSPYQRPPHPPIPQGIRRVAVLSVHPSAAYPGVPGCGAVNIVRGGSLGWLPGPWNIVGDPNRPEADRRRAWATLMDERARLRSDIQASDTQLIIADISPHKAYFERPIDYMRFIGPLPGYRPVRRVGRFELWAKAPLSASTCVEKF